MRGMIRLFDGRISTRISRLPSSIRPLMLLVTLIGQPPFTVGASLAVIGYGFLVSRGAFVTMGVVAVVTFAVCSFLKIGLRRPRPASDYVKAMIIQTFSFPSGHAAGSLVCFGLLGIVVGIVAGLAIGIVASILIGILCLLIGISRIYLGAHYPSDVLGGWIVGGGGLVIISIIGMSA